MVKNITDKKVMELVESLHLDIEVILEKFKFTFDEKTLSREEAISFIEFLRNELN